MEWHVIKYRIAGVDLYAVEDDSGYIYRYCNSLSRAEEIANKQNWRGQC